MHIMRESRPDVLSRNSSRDPVKGSLWLSVRASDRSGLTTIEWMESPLFDTAGRLTYLLIYCCCVGGALLRRMADYTILEVSRDLHKALGPLRATPAKGGRFRKRREGELPEWKCLRPVPAIRMYSSWAVHARVRRCSSEWSMPIPK